MTVWKPVPNAPHYEISDDGQVRSFKPYHGTPVPRILKGWKSADGYRVVSIITNDGEQKLVVHRLMGSLFLGPRPEGMEIRHVNGDPLDNRVVNLAYGTHAQNMQDMVRHGTHNQARKTHCVHGHEYTPENTIIRHTERGRRCRTCRDAQHRAYSRAKRAAMAA